MSDFPSNLRRYRNLEAKKDKDVAAPRPWDVVGGHMELADAQRAGVFNLAGVCLGHTGHAARASSVLELLPLAVEASELYWL